MTATATEPVATATSTPEVAAVVQNLEPTDPPAPATPTEPDSPIDFGSASRPDPAPFVLLGAILFAMAAAAGQAMRNDPLLLQRLVRGFDGARRPGTGSGAAGHAANGVSNAQAHPTDVYEHWPTLAGQPISSAPDYAISFDQAGVHCPDAGGSLGGGHGGGGAKAGPGQVEFASHLSDAPPSPGASHGGQLGGSHGGGAAKVAPGGIDAGGHLANHVNGPHCNTADAFAKAAPGPTDFAPGSHSLPDPGAVQSPTGGSLGGALGGSQGGPVGGHGGSVLGNGLNGGGSVPNGALGGAHGGSSVARMPLGDPGLASGGLGGGQLGGAVGGGPLPGPDLGGLAAPIPLDQAAACSPLPDAMPPVDGFLDVQASAEALIHTQPGLGAAGLAASARARDESTTWAGRLHCRVCGREPEAEARFCGYCGEALDRTLH